MVLLCFVISSYLLMLAIRVVAVTDPCNRDCDDTEMICIYEMNITLETTMNIFCGDCPYVLSDCMKKGCNSAGGIVRPITVANNMLPGPPIIVCENDIIEVTVRNELRSETTSIHWHGIHQVGTFFMDGLPLVSQFPILPLDTFKYKFRASPQGTHMWHGHSSFQESDGLYGALIVKHKKTEHLESLYDFDLPEHIVAIWHWYDQATADVLVPILHKNESVIGFGFLVNGKGALKDFKRDSKVFNTPKEIFHVNQTYRYRFRLLFNSAIYCAIQVSVDDHKLKIIASETSYFEPVDVDSFMVGPGDRFDFVLDASKEAGCYSVRIKGVGDCGPPKASVHQEAYLCYGESLPAPLRTSYREADRNGTLLNPFEEATYDYYNKTLIHFVDLNSTEPALQDYSGPPDEVYYVELQSRINENARFPGAWHQFNNVTFLYPSASFLRNKYSAEDLCTDETKGNFCTKDYCSCTYSKQLNKDSLVEIVLVDLNTEGIQDHPVHLHGYKFHIVAMDAVGTNISITDIKYRNEKGLIKKNLGKAISKDTVSVPNRGYAILRFVASNPGVWLFHCHVTNHMELGMAMLLQVGTNEEIMEMCEHQQQCGHWSSSVSSAVPKSLLLATICPVFYFNILIKKYFKLL